MKTVSPKVCFNVTMSSSNSAAPIGSSPDVGLVEEDDLRIERQRAGERCALDHAARKFGGQLVGGIGLEADEVELDHRHLLQQGGRQLEIFAHRHLNVLLDAERREQRALLEHDAETALQRAALSRVQCVDILAEHLDRAAGLLDEAEDGAREHGFALPRTTDEAEDLAAHHVEIEPFHDDVVAEGDLEAAHADHGLAGLLRSRRRGAGFERLSVLPGWVSAHRKPPQNAIDAKNMAKSPSTTMTMKMAFTTEAVT